MYFLDEETQQIIKINNKCEKRLQQMESIYIHPIKITQFEVLHDKLFLIVDIDNILHLVKINTKCEIILSINNVKILFSAKYFILSNTVYIYILDALTNKISYIENGINLLKIKSLDLPEYNIPTHMFTYGFLNENILIVSNNIIWTYCQDKWVKHDYLHKIKEIVQSIGFNFVVLSYDGDIGSIEIPENENIIYSKYIHVLGKIKNIHMCHCSSLILYTESYNVCWCNVSPTERYNKGLYYKVMGSIGTLKLRKCIESVDNMKGYNDYILFEKNEKLYLCVEKLGLYYFDPFNLVELSNPNGYTFSSLSNIIKSARKI